MKKKLKINITPYLGHFYKLLFFGYKLKSEGLHFLQRKHQVRIETI